MLFLVGCALNGSTNAKLGCACTRSHGPLRLSVSITCVFRGAMERWLDAGHGSCVLPRHDCAAFVAEALRHFDGARLAIISAVVMPNHVHALFVQKADWPLEELLRSWKSFSSRKINSLLGRDGSLWQRDYFDRLVRDEKHFANCVRYIRRNPGKVYLQRGEYILYESELAHSIE
jgi:putative transposase